ncbi:MAG TPA: GNAT family N-acetyltransferase [Thermomicrobiales bacterium]|nr:GNAT family N-acetyltransferase [Thermomicrobiales bacterium]
MTVAIAPYQPEQAPALIAIWNRALGERFPLTERLWRQNVDGDPNYAPGDGLVARRADGTIVGFVITRVFRQLASNPDMATYRALGWLVALAVAPEEAGHGIGSELLAAAEARLREEGATACDAGGSVGHLLPGPPLANARALRFWERHGYQPEHAVYDLQRNLRDWVAPPVPDAVQRGEWRLGPARPGQEAAILDFLGRAFPGRWRYATATAFAHGVPAGDVVVLEDRGGTVQGFLALWDWRSPVLGPSSHWFPVLGEQFGGIGPLGIAREVRGQGLGLALVAAGARELQARGVAECTIDWTGLTGFYGRLGFQTTDGYWRCTPKTLTSRAVGQSGGRAVDLG